MKITYDEWIKKINDKLAQHNQLIRVIEFGKQHLKLSNGIMLTGNEFSRFKKRIFNEKTDIWVTNLDNLVAKTITEKEIRSALCKKGGIACQKKHGDKIKKNFTNRRPWNAGTKGQNIGSMGPRPQHVKDAISLKNSGSGNGMYGTKMSEVDKAYRSQLVKKKILEGTFTPNSNNRNTHWDAWFNNKKYRSSWEALYQYINPDAEYETLRLSYIWQNQSCVYIVDFVDHTKKLVVEVKPKELCKGEKFYAKIKALKSWAKNNNYTVIVADREWFRQNIVSIDYSYFDENTARKIKKLCV